MGYNGLYPLFPLNRPLSKDDINYQFRKNFSGMEKVDSLALDNSKIIKMNSTYLELVDKYYQERGMVDLFVFILLSIFFLPSLIFIYLSVIQLVKESGSASGFSSCLLMSVMSGAFSFFCYKLLMKSWFTWTHYPVRFNRKTQMVYIFNLDGTIISTPWKEVFFTRVKESGAIPNYNIHGHILAADRTTVIDTFSLGFSGSRQDLVENWAFIYSYMTVDNCLEDLQDIVALCPPIAEEKESYTFGLQYMLRVESRLEWLLLILKLPLLPLASIARYIAMRSSNIPRWSAEVEADCMVEPNDPINVSAANNPKHLWRYVLANQSLAEYQALYQRQEQAENRLRAKVQAHKQQQTLATVETSE